VFHDEYALMDDDITFQDEINRPTINIARAALCFARSLAYPILDVDHYLSRLDALAQAARPYLEDAQTVDDRVDALSDFLFYQREFAGNHHDYNDPRNSYLNCVLDRKMGIPISLSVLYTSIARRLGLPAYGVGLPGHFIVGVYQGGRQIYLDPFNAGMRLSLADCGKLVKESTGFHGAFQPRWLTPISPNDVLARMLTNLCNAYVQREDWRSAIPVIQHLLMLQPSSDFHLRDLGFVYMYNGSLRLAAQYMEEYLRRSPGAADFENVRTSLQIIAGRLALWN
jgi:regulator of sirC expression with transglutaminase-like and TPR domain